MYHLIYSLENNQNKQNRIYRKATPCSTRSKALFRLGWGTIDSSTGDWCSKPVEHQGAKHPALQFSLWTTLIRYTMSCGTRWNKHRWAQSSSSLSRSMRNVRYVKESSELGFVSGCFCCSHLNKGDQDMRMLFSKQPRKPMKICENHRKSQGQRKLIIGSLKV